MEGVRSASHRRTTARIILTGALGKYMWSRRPPPSMRLYVRRSHSGRGYGWRGHSPSWPDETEKPSVGIAHSHIGILDLNCG